MCAMSSCPPIVITHAGAFHADEIMAIALLERFAFASPLRIAMGWAPSAVHALLVEGVRPEVPTHVDGGGLEDCRQPVWVLRTRQPELLAAGRAREDVFVIDVGGHYDPSRLNFDHHQSDMTLSWSQGTPYSSTGLIWRWLEEAGKLSGLSPAVRAGLADRLIEPLDAHDNGVRISPDASVVEDYNRGGGGDPEVQLAQFEKALRFCRDRLDNAIHVVSNQEAARDVLAYAWARASTRGERFVILDEPLPGTDGTRLLHEVSQGKALLLGLPSQSSRYSLISLPATEDRFSIVCPVPESWRGRMDFDVVLGDFGAARLAFAHKTGFMCVVEGGPREVRSVASYLASIHQADSP